MNFQLNADLDRKSELCAKDSIIKPTNYDQGTHRKGCGFARAVAANIDFFASRLVSNVAPKRGRRLA